MEEFESDLQYQSDDDDTEESNKVNNYEQPTENETSCIIQEICENTDVEITSLSHANVEKNSNNDYVEPNVEHMTNSNPSVKDYSLGSTDKNLDLCLICESKIYPMEKLAVDGRLYHKGCFRCSKCRAVLSVTNFNLSNNSIYCKIHFMELFKIRGKYDDVRSIGNEIVSQSEEPAETIPSTDTKSLLEKFRQLESGSVSYQSSHSKNSNNTVRYVNSTDDVVRSQDIQQDEMPPPETAKAMVAKFQALESKKNIPTPERVQQMQSQAKVNSTTNANVRFYNNSSIQSNPIPDSLNETEELPEEGTTRNLLNKFQNLSNNA